MLTDLEVKKTIKQVANSISAVLNVDIMIMDDNFKVVGGTAKHPDKYFISSVYRHIMKTGEPTVIENPGFNRLCKSCKLYEKCPEAAEFDCPIVLNNEVIGVISLVGYTDEHKDMMLSRKNDYMVFLMRMGELISSKVLEVSTAQRLEVTALKLTHIVNSVNEGIIAIDENGIITHCNKAAEKLFNVSYKNILGEKVESIIPSFPSSYRTIGERITFKKKELSFYSENGKEVYCYVSLNPIIDAYNKNVGAIITIVDAGDMKKFVSDVMGYNHRGVQFSDIIGKGPAMMKVKQNALKAAENYSTILIRGESGTGKELFARAIHNHSPIFSGPFIAINCAAIPESLLESELFGYEGGAFTGAKKEGKPGKFELADGGTLFLDEIGDMPLYLQAKLLRVLQEKSIQRVGGIKEIPIDVRIISATNKDLEELVIENRFREDLFYRLNVIPISIPSLSVHREDIPYIVNHLLNKYRPLFDKDIVSIDNEVKEIFMTYSWPGNVRELENVLEYAMNMETSNIISINSLPDYIINSNYSHEIRGKTLKDIMDNLEKSILMEKLEQYGSDLEMKKKIAKDLDIGIATLYRKLKEYELD